MSREPAGGNLPSPHPALQAVSPPLCSWAALGCPCPQCSSAGIDEVLRVEWGENILPKSWGMLGTAQNGPLGTDFFLPPFESSYLFQFPKYGCKGLENWEGKVGREQPRLCLIRTLNPERFLIRLITAPMCLGEIFPSFSSHLWQKEILGGNKSMAQVLFGSSGTGCVPMGSHWFIGILPAGMGGAVGPALGCWFWAHPQGSTSWQLQGFGKQELGEREGGGHWVGLGCESRCESSGIPELSGLRLGITQREFLPFVTGGDTWCHLMALSWQRGPVPWGCWGR